MPDVLFNVLQGPVAQTLDTAIQWINHYQKDKFLGKPNPLSSGYIEIYSVDSVIHLSNNWAQLISKAVRVMIQNGITTQLQSTPNYIQYPFIKLESQRILFIYESTSGRKQ